MPVWRCPHCATPQAEASRCWVCRRSTTSCVTCRHYRRGLSGGLGLCGLDPRHAPVANTDVRACWVNVVTANPEADPGLWTTSPAAASAGAPAAVGSGGRAPRTFVPVEELVPRRASAAVAVLERPGAPSSAEEAAQSPAADPGRAPIAELVAPPVRPSAQPVVPPIAEAAADREPVAVMAPVDAPARTLRPVPGRWWLWGDPDPWPERLGEPWF